MRPDARQSDTWHASRSTSPVRISVSMRTGRSATASARCSRAFTRSEMALRGSARSQDGASKSTRRRQPRCRYRRRATESSACGMDRTCPGFDEEFLWAIGTRFPQLKDVRMRLFITGATGHIGSALLPELLAEGHTVVGLARSGASAAVLAAAGVEIRCGSLDDLADLREAALAADGVIHLAFKHELLAAGEFARAAESDLRVVEAIGSALEGSGKPFVITSGTALLAMAAPGRLGLEKDVLAGGPRADSENAAMALAA